MAYHSLLEAIGNTPTVGIRSLNPVAGTNIYAKLEFFNPTGSLKDRIVSFMVERGITDDEDAFQAARDLARWEGLFVGMSSGAVVHVMVQQTVAGRRCVVGVLGDSGSKYLSTELFL